MKLVISKTRIHKSKEIHLTSGMVGQTIDVEFSEDWDGLNKVAVFTNGKITKDVINPTDSLTIPWEVLAEPNKTASVGFYGYSMVNGEKVLAIPTIYIDLGRIDKGADPSGDPSAEPTPTVAEQLQAEVDDHEQRITDLEEHGGGGEGSNEIWLPAVDSNGNISWSKSSTETAPTTRNIKGDKGDTGATGPRGPQGPAYELTAADKAEIAAAAAEKINLSNYAEKSDLEDYVAIEQGASNVNKVLAVGSDGNVTVKAITDIISDGDEVEY